jgi:hypothetical protein
MPQPLSEDSRIPYTWSEEKGDTQFNKDLSSNFTFRPYQYDRAPGAFLPQQEPQYQPRAGQFGQLGAAPELTFRNTPYGLPRPGASQPYPAKANTDVWKTNETYGVLQCRFITQRNGYRETLLVMKWECTQLYCYCYHSMDDGDTIQK